MKHKRIDKRMPCVNCIRFPICVSLYSDKLNPSRPAFIFAYYVASKCDEFKKYVFHRRNYTYMMKSVYEYFINWREYET